MPRNWKEQRGSFLTGRGCRLLGTRVTEELDYQGLWCLCILPRPTVMRKAVCILSPAPWLAGNPGDVVGQVREMRWGEWGVGCGCWSVFPRSSSFPVCIHGAAGLRGLEQCCLGGWRAIRALSLLPWPLWSLCALVLPADNPRLEFHLWVSPAVWRSAGYLNFASLPLLS